MATSKKSGFMGSFEISDRDSCAKAIKNGGVAALISAAITGVFGLVGIFGAQTSSQDLNYLLDPWILVDVVFIVALAIFVFRKSRIAATVLVVYFMVSKAIMWIDLGAPKGVLLSIIFFLYYVTAMRGTYLWHSKYREEGIGATAA